MPSGGARAGAGGPQNPDALDTSRRKVASGLVVLPREERTEEPPDFPLSDLTATELEMWARYWRKPQAQYWLDFQMVEVVALFVRQFCEAATPKNSAENRKAAQSFFSVLGLTSPALKAAGYTIAEPPTVEAAAPRRDSRASQLKVVPGGRGR